MRGFFMAGSELVHWDLTAAGRSGPFRLAIRHARGVIVEYFNDVSSAMHREQQLERLFVDTASPASLVAAGAGADTEERC